MCPCPGGGALQVQGNAEMDKLFRPKLGEKEGGDQVEALPHLPGLRSTINRTAVGHIVLVRSTPVRIIPSGMMQLY